MFFLYLASRFLKNYFFLAKLFKPQAPNKAKDNNKIKKQYKVNVEVNHIRFLFKHHKHVETITTNNALPANKLNDVLFSKFLESSTHHTRWVGTFNRANE